MNHSEAALFDPRERQAEKQASRDADARALRGGELSEAELHRKNGLLAFPRESLRVDFAGFIDRSRRAKKTSGSRPAAVEIASK